MMVAYVAAGVEICPIQLRDRNIPAMCKGAYAMLGVLLVMCGVVGIDTAIEAYASN
jgi:hypothetical protein